MHTMTHYYGDVVRKLFIAAGVLMLLSLPFFQLLIPVPAFFSILAVLVLVLCAGLIAPSEKWTMILDMVMAGASLIVFEYYAVVSYRASSISFFIGNEVLAVIFLIAFYYAVKTVRGASTEQSE